MMFKFKFNLKLAVPTSQHGRSDSPARADQAVTRDLPPVSVARRSGEGPGRRASQYLNQVKISESSHDSARAGRRARESLSGWPGRHPA